MLAAAAQPPADVARWESPPSPSAEQPEADDDYDANPPLALETPGGGWSTAGDVSPPVEPHVAATAKPELAPAGSPPARRASADKRNRRCAVIENTIIAADGGGFLGTTATLVEGIEDESCAADPHVVSSLRVDDYLPAEPVPVSAPETGEDDRIGGEMQHTAESQDSVRDMLLSRPLSPVTVGEESQSDAPSSPRLPVPDQNPLQDYASDGLAFVEASAEPETSLNVDLAIANETNEASLPKIRKLNRRKSSLRRAANLEAEDGDSQDSSRPATPGGTPPTSPSTLSAMAAMSENTVGEGDVGIGEEEACGAAVALKRRLSLRLSAMSAYNPETDSDPTLHRNSSFKTGGLRGSRVRLRHESLKYRRQPEWDSSSDAEESRASGNGTEAEGRQDERSGRVRSAALGHRKSRSYGGLDRRERPRSTFDWRKLAPISDQSAGSLTETVIGPDGELIVLGPSIAPRRASDSDGTLPNGSYASRPPSPPPTVAEESHQPPQISVSEPDKAQAQAKDSGEAKPSPTQGPADDSSEAQLSPASGESKISPSTSPKSPTIPVRPAEVSSPPSAAEKTGTLAPPTRHDDETPKGKSFGKNQQQQQLCPAGHAPPLPSSAKQKLSSAFSWFFGEGDAGASKKSTAASNASSSASPSASSLAAPGSSPPASQAGIAGAASTNADGSSPFPAGESPAPTGVSPPAPVSSAKEGRHRKASAALSALFSVRGSKSSPSKAAADSNSPAGRAAQQQGGAAGGGKLTLADQPAALAERFPLHVERAIYRLSHAKLANPRRPLSHQVLISNMMFWYLALLARQQPKHPQMDQRAAKSGSQHSDDEEDEESEAEERQRRRKAKKKAEKDKKAEKEGKKKKKDTRH